MTQCTRLLQAFQEKQDLMVYEIMTPRPQGLGIAQYNARIKELKEQGHPIINVKPGHFRYIRENKIQVKELLMTDTTTPAYQKFKEAGEALKQGKLPETKYQSMAYTELITMRERAQEWLAQNGQHPNYQTALGRYEQICDQISLLEGEGLV
jgi:hypothetical protein